MKLSPILLPLATIAILAIGSPAYADDEVHPEIAAMLDEVPGGSLVGYYSAYWPDLDMIMTVANAGARAVGTCATNAICAYTSTSMQGTKLAWGSCATHAIPAGFVTKSVANARPAGSVAQARSGSTIVASVSAGAWKNVTGIDNIRCLE